MKGVALDSALPPEFFALERSCWAWPWSGVAPIWMTQPEGTEPEATAAVVVDEVVSLSSVPPVSPCSVRSSAGTALSAAAGAGGSPEDAGRAYTALLLRLIDAERFPALHPLVTAGVFEGPATTDADFEFGLQRILDGVEVRARTARP